MHIERIERLFLVVAGGILAAMVVAVLVAASAEHASLPEPAERVDPATLRETAPFDDPGVFHDGDNRYTVVIVASAWQFEPSEIRVPVGSEVRFIVSSTDVIHGFLIPGTQVNAMLVPGQVTDVTTEFDDVGTHRLICHEYCGLNHHEMSAELIVEEAA
ncbi:MAG: cytochrome c oxidase subunit II [Acidimicrobiales bacterium]|nr:cytochrome c oxidase subunit II [Acidimicrobiales bacterium]